ncbi:MAG TPA: PAS domain S-box protein, partial [Candidatus Hydrogenedentes bacterium]|nr:PAS domain S-box protein [Candidatus Hydrogenedentota bacterium]
DGNPRLEELLGFRRDELIGRSLRELNAWPDQAAVADMWRRVQAGETVHRVIPHRRKDGRIIQCAVSARLTNRQDNTRILAVLRDITEQVAARQVELAWSDRMRRLTAAAPGIAYEFRKNPDGTYCLPFASDRMYEFFGIPHETLVRSAQPIFDRIHPDDMAEFMLSIQRSERTMMPWRHEFRLRHRNGNWLWFLGQSIPSRDPDGGITWRGFLLDVTESRRLGDALRERERFLASLLEALPIGVLVVRREDGRVALVNPGLAAMVGRDPEATVGMSCAELLCGLPPDSCPLHLSDADMEKQDTFFLDRPDGSRIPVLRIVRPYDTPGGEHYLLLVLMDIRERQELENALRESEHRYRQLADTIPALVWISGPDGACVDFNRAWLAFRGRSMEEELGHGWLDGVHPDDRDRVIKAYQDALAVRAEFTMTYRLLRHDGIYRWVEDHGIPRFDPSGQFLGYAGGCMDVTERQEAAAYLETVMNCVQAGIFVSDAGSGLLLDANREAERLTDRSRDELIGQPWRDLLLLEQDPPKETDAENARDARIHTPRHHSRVVRVREMTGNVGERHLLVQSLMDITDLRRLLESQDIDIALARRLMDAVTRPRRRHVDLGNNLSLFVDTHVWPCQKAGGDHALVRVAHDLTHGSMTSLALCDQSGHEVNCVLRRIYTTLILDNLLRVPRHSLGDRLERLNALLEQSGVFRDSEFVTGWFADINHDAAILHCAACGHPPAFLVRDGQVILLPDPNSGRINGPIAILPGTSMTVTAERLKPGDRIIACTDGLLEMPQRNRQRRFTAPMLARVLRAIVQEKPDASARELGDTLLAAVCAF